MRRLISVSIKYVSRRNLTMESNTIAALKQAVYQNQFSLEKDRALAIFSKTSLKLAEQLLLQHGDSLSPSVFVAWWQANYSLYAHKQIIISALNYKGEDATGRYSDEDEYIEITNQGPAILDLAGWQIHAGPDQKMIFKANSLIKRGETIRVYTFDKGHYSFNSKQPIWNNRGDRADLYDAGAELISQWTYGRKAETDIVISHLMFDGQERLSEGDEYVELANLGGSWVDISGWSLGGGHADDFIFSEESRIAPNGIIRVYTNKLDAKTGGYSWDSKRAIWNNNGGKAYLKGWQDRLVSEYAY